ncbi:alpha-D-ribose 1-methylphosphonate 5-triphosphate diphosphatase [Gemmobacter caeni]|jgi:alpha-D-ribose 1-methylphosphonate 5-triphosphate diphosphatase|uniref:Alpha-D-ribose 1-methylphosphonate 5-triphosphate diphosphatase n=2 Tax=Gemmobacter TaxID=204456 RepID=A0A2T6B2Y1_9RHOB|nr:MULTISPECIES: alpha-D-ribose 1-methylphosphonate 5-triphosphate diphosphatase [Gemmobacter]PTX50385.1 alpha-D-ribose 1-methylphosphonate 5-triphosphate diphosphatase [Gemmobacter caeni]TWI98398.1 alpha-D-ribose 1-methylphosphonate 5-triphosphate diphosphatase [Gemmobacter caeni]GHC27233.1 phosphonate metabolism protein PhnM [Gemmobacter nanjingensis]
MTDTILANATLVLPGETLRGQVRLSDGRITDIAEGAAVPAGAIDCAGDLVMPGLIELHTDNLERHIEPRPRVGWPHQAAIIAHDAELASVGITTVFDALRVGSVVSNKKANYGEYARALADEILDLRAQGALRISHFLHLRAEVCSETLVAELAKFGAEDRIGIVSLMDHTPGERQFRDVTKLKDYLCGKHGLSEAEFHKHVADQRALRDQVGAVHEAAVVSEARRFGAVLASHDDTTAPQVAVSAGHGVHFAEFPTTTEAAQACHDHGIRVMMGAPNLIRGGSHSGNVAAQDLAQADLLDIVSSDYVPSSLLSAALMLGDVWGDTARGIATVTAAPAEATGLEDRGHLVPGGRADVIRVTRIGQAGAVRGVWVQGRRVA